MYTLSDEIQTCTVSDQNSTFRTESFSEFMRFYNFVGERPIIKDLLESLKSNDVFYDIGANVGTYTCFAASKFGSQQIVAFEPEPQNINRLHENLRLNNLDVESIEAALSDSNGTVDLALSGNDAGEGEHTIATGQDSDTIEVKMVRGDLVIKQRELPAPTVLKIDVEGAELSVLRGLQETIQEHVRLVYLEVHPEKLPQFGDTAPEVRAFLEEAGFDVVDISERGDEVFLRASR